MDAIIQVDPDRANQVLKEIDAIIEWKNTFEKVVEGKMMHLANNLLEAYNNAYWTVRGYEDESQYIEATFAQSRSLYYDLIRIAKNLNHYDHRMLEAIGVAKCRELCKVQKALGVIPANYFLNAQEDDREKFKDKVKVAITGAYKQKDENNGKQDEGSTFVTLAFKGDQIYDWSEAVKIAMMEATTDSTTEAACILAKDFLSGYRDDGKGRVYNRNSFLLGMVKRIYDQIDRTKEGIYDRMIAQLATWVEEGRDEPSADVENKESETE